MLLEFSSERYANSMQSMIGSNVEVLWEKDIHLSNAKKCIGHTENYYPVIGKGLPNTMQPAEITGIDDVLNYLCVK